MKQLIICDSLYDDGKINTWKFCAPVFIADIFFGTIIAKDENLVFEEYDDNSIRSGTLTFVSFKGEFFAITCNHVLIALERKQKKWRKEQKQKFNLDPGINGYGLFTPIGSNQFHFNYTLSPVPKDSDGNQPDVAIARVEEDSITRLNRTAIALSNRDPIPETGIASGYPEHQRLIRQGKKLNTFSPNFTTCVASLQKTDRGEILLQDTIDADNGVDNLSGMSGGPIIWSDENEYGLAGIVKKGLDIKPKPGQFMEENCIWIHGERFTTELFDYWLQSIPPLNKLKDESKTLYVPPKMRV